jgi:two-component system sensor histidine kinase DesK
MLNRFTTDRFAAAGALAYLLFGGIEVLVFLVSGVGNADLNMPAGVLAETIASWFSEAPSLVRAGNDRRAITYAIVVGWQAIMTVMFAVMLVLRPRLKHRSRLGAIVLALQIVVGVSTLSSMLYVLAAELAFIKPLRQGLKWLAAQMALLSLAVVYMVFVRGNNLGDAMIELVFIYAGFGLVFQAIAFGMAQIAKRERAARTALTASNAHLLATQSMLGDTVRAVERVRIARDLHDAVGHHLTALNLHLDLALRQAADAAPESLRTSRELARSLLAEVRAVVSSERSDQCINLRAAIDTMCAGIPSPRIACTYEEGLEIASPVLANTLFYCVQEALTNAARHADAEVLNIDLRSRGDAVALSLRDNGRGCAGAAEGNGLRGMRERVEEQGGTLRCDRDGPGFGIDICLPLNRSAA